MTTNSNVMNFARTNAPWLVAAAALSLSSSFGQTFFISLFAGEIRGEFGLTHGQWGGIYTIGTLFSAFVMLFAGGLTDKTRVRTIAIIFLVAIAMVCLSMAAVPGAWALPFIIFGLRFCGQGMLSHTSSVAIGRWFARGRGRANAFASMGYLSGEAILPFCFVLLMGAIGWRLSWVVAAALALAFIPLFRSVLKTERQPQATVEADEQTGMLAKHWTRKDMLSHWLFWVVSLVVIAPSTFGTAYFFHQVHLTDTKGWNLAAYAALIPFYSICSLASTFGFGALADRFGAARIIPIALLPGAAAFCLASYAVDLWVAGVAFMLLGAMQGANSTVAGTFWPEYYGTRHLGSVRAVATSVMVLGSAIGPGVTGYLIDYGVTFETQLLWMAAYMVIISAIMVVALERARHLLSANRR